MTVDNTGPSASVDDPGTPLRGTVSLTGSASDPGGAGVASAAFQRSPASGGTWTTVDTDTSSPYSVSFDTTAVADGLYDFRLVATDQVGNTTVSALVTNRRVDNTAPAASLDDPGANLRGTVTLSSTASDAGSGIATRTYQHSPAGAGTWTTTPAAFDTTAVTDGLYDLRVIVTDNAGNSTTSASRNQPAGRQHGSLRQSGRSGRQPERHRHPLLDRLRPGRLRYRHAHLSALSRRRRHLDDDSGRLRHDRRYGRALRPARDRHRQRR